VAGCLRRRIVSGFAADNPLSSTMPTPDPAPRARDVPFYVIPFIVATAFLMEALDSNIITASIPAMADAFGVTPIRLNLAITSYIVSLAIFIPISGWLADRVGAKRLFVWAIMVFTVGSMLCGMATSFEMLIVARVLQGVGGALMTPSGRLILLRSFSKAELVTAIAYMTTPIVVGPLLGPVLGGFLTTYASWRWIFFINLPIGLIGFFAARRYIHDMPPEPKAPFDMLGFLLCAAALVVFQVGLENLIHPMVPAAVGYLLFPGAVLLGLSFWLHARRSARPVLDIGLFALRPFRTGVIAGGLSRTGMNAVPFLLQLKLQLGFGYSPLHAGVLVFVTAFGSLALKTVTKRILRIVGFRRLLSVNAAVGGVLTAGFAWFTPATPTWLMVAYIFVFGFSRSMQFTSINALIYADVPKSRQSGSVALGGCAQQVTMGLGISISAVLIAAHGPAAVPDVKSFDAALLLMGVIPFLSMLGFLRLKAEDGMEASGHVPGRRRAAA
jgi:EmrB/QacA subfamily drug resistance transporter